MAIPSIRSKRIKVQNVGLKKTGVYLFFVWNHDLIKTVRLVSTPPLPPGPKLGTLMAPVHSLILYFTYLTNIRAYLCQSGRAAIEIYGRHFLIGSTFQTRAALNPNTENDGG